MLIKLVVATFLVTAQPLCLGKFVILKLFLDTCV